MKNSAFIVSTFYRLVTGNNKMDVVYIPADSPFHDVLVRWHHSVKEITFEQMNTDITAVSESLLKSMSLK